VVGASTLGDMTLFLAVVHQAQTTFRSLFGGVTSLCENTLHLPFRPNPIDVTVVDVLAVERAVLRARGLGALDATRFLDIKRV